MCWFFCYGLGYIFLRLNWHNVDKIETDCKVVPLHYALPQSLFGTKKKKLMFLRLTKHFHLFNLKKKGVCLGWRVKEKNWPLFIEKITCLK